MPWHISLHYLMPQHDKKWHSIRFPAAYSDPYIQNTTVFHDHTTLKNNVHYCSFSFSFQYLHDFRYLILQTWTKNLLVYKCPDIDECSTDEATCGRSQICRNLPGSYECVCQAGFRSAGRAICIGKNGILTHSNDTS